MTGRIYLRAIVPIGVLYSASLVCSNQVYLYLSVAFIQMLKAGAPMAVLITTWAFGVSNPKLNVLVNVLIIVTGVALASFGEIKFIWIGFFFQMGGIVFEAIRLVLIQILLSGEGQKMDPLVSLYYYAPVCALMNLIVAAANPNELPAFVMADFWRVGPFVMLANAGVAFFLNMASVFLVCHLCPIRKMRLTIPDWENLRPSHDPLWCPEKYSPGRSIHFHLGYRNYLAPICWLRYRHPRPHLLRRRLRRATNIP